MARAPRLTMFFTDGEYGWSETHWDMLATSLQQALANGKNLISPRRQLLASGPWLQALRVSYDDTWRDSLLYTTIPPKSSPPWGYQNNAAWDQTYAAPPYQVMLLRAESGVFYRKSIYIAGMPSTDAIDAPPIGLDPVLQQAVLNYEAALTGQYGFKVLVRDPAVAPYKTIISITNIVGSNNSQISCPGHGLTQGQRFAILQAKQSGARSKINGDWYAGSIIDANTFIAQNLVLAAGSTFLTGLLQSRNIDYVPYSRIIWERLTHRKRGRPFDSPRGRARRRTSVA